MSVCSLVTVRSLNMLGKFYCPAHLVSLELPTTLCPLKQSKLCFQQSPGCTSSLPPLSCPTPHESRADHRHYPLVTIPPAALYPLLEKVETPRQGAPKSRLCSPCPVTPFHGVVKALSKQLVTLSTPTACTLAQSGSLLFL